MVIPKNSSSYKPKNSDSNPKAKNKRQNFLRKHIPTSITVNDNSLQKNLDNRHKKSLATQNSLEKKMDANCKVAIAGSVLAGVAAGASVAGAAHSALSEHDNKSMFSEFLQKNVPIDKMHIISAHNAGTTVENGTILPISNQNMSVFDTLDKTPVRGFDIDVWNYNGDAVINHGGIFNPFISPTKLKDNLESINTWLNRPENHDEAVFFNFENERNIPHGMLESVFGKDAVLTPSNFNQFFPDKTSSASAAPTVHELTQKGIKAVVMHSDYVSAGHATLRISDYHTIENRWEDRSMIEYLHGIHSEAAGQLTTSDFDNLRASSQGGFYSIDKISEHDPRFYTADQRAHLNLKPNIEVAGQSYSSNDSYNAIFLGIGTASAAGTVSMSTVMGAFQAYANELTIRKQDKIIPNAIADIELSRILLERQKQQKTKENPKLSEINKPVTIEEIKATYKKEKLFGITKSTIIPGIGATLGILSSMLALSLLFPYIGVIFWGLATATAGVGLIAVAISTAMNRKRLNKAIDKAFDNPNVSKAVEKRIYYINEQLNYNLPSEKLEENPEYTNEYIKKLLAAEETTANLITGVNISVSAMLLARISSFGKYFIPVFAIAAGAIGITFTSIFVAFNAIINFRKRRNKLASISQFIRENETNDLHEKQKRKLLLFGKTALQRFIYQDKQMLFESLGMPADSKFSEAFKKLALDENEQILNNYITLFTIKKLTKELTRLAAKQNPPISFNEATRDKNILNDLLKQYMINKSCKLASHDTWKHGIFSLFSLIAIGFFFGFFFTPFIGLAVAVAIGITGIVISKAAAMKESKLFRERITHILSADKSDLNKADLLHRKDLDALLDNWNRMFYDPTYSLNVTETVL